MKKLKVGAYFLFFSAIFFISILLQNSQTEIVCRNPSSTSPSSICIEPLTRVVDAHSRKATLGVLRQELAEVETNIWSAETLFPIFRSAVQESQNWTDFIVAGIKKNAKVFWIQQRELKSLNEQHWNLAGTEYYLAVLDLELTKLLDKNPELGTIIHRNYKDRVVVSSLLEDEFAKQVMSPLKEIITKRFLEARYGELFMDPAQMEYWKNWINTRLVFTSSRSFVEAHLKHKGIDLQSYNAWKSQTESLIQELKPHFTNTNDFFAALDLIRKTREDPEQVKKIGNTFNLSKAQLEMLQVLNEKLQAADFLPTSSTLSSYEAEFLQQFFSKIQNNKENLKRAIDKQKGKFEESWLLQRQIFLRNTFKSGHSILALDRKNFGSLALKARLQWFEEGARLDDLPHIYENLSRDLVDDYDRLVTKIRIILGQNGTEVFLYRSGDDALVSLPQMTAQQKTQVEALLVEVAQSYHSFLSEIIYKSDRATNVANAIFDAREKLFKIQ